MRWLRRRDALERVGRADTTPTRRADAALQPGPVTETSSPAETAARPAARSVRVLSLPGGRPREVLIETGDGRQEIFPLVEDSGPLLGGGRQYLLGPGRVLGAGAATSGTGLAIERGDRVAITGTVREIAAGTAIIALDGDLGLAPVPVEACANLEPPFLGALTIEVPTAPPRPGAILGAGLAPFRAENGDFLEPGDTGQPVIAARITIRAHPGNVLLADLVLFVTTEGDPIFDGTPVLDDAKRARTGVFRFIVQQIRFAS